jgi:hypothetical protein
MTEDTGIGTMRTPSAFLQASRKIFAECLDEIAAEYAVASAAHGKPKALIRQIEEGKVRHPDTALKLLAGILKGGKPTAPRGAPENLWPAIIAATYVRGRKAMGVSQAKAIEEIAEKGIRGLRDEREIRRALQRGVRSGRAVLVGDFFLATLIIWSRQYVKTKETLYQALNLLFEIPQLKGVGEK